MRGLGPLLFFSYANVFCAGLIIVNKLSLKKYFFAFIFFLITILINNIGYSRGQIILLSSFILFYYSIVGVFNYKTLIYLLIGGIFLIALQLLRLGYAADANFVVGTLFGIFLGDFPEIVNTSHVIEYFEYNDFIGSTVILGNLWYYIPRALYEAKPTAFAGTLLNIMVFPDMYLGDDGGSTTTFGLFGITYAVYGLISVLFLSIIFAYMLRRIDILYLNWLSLPVPSFFFFFYINLIGSIQVLHREGFLAIFGAFNQAILIMLFMFICKFIYIFFQKITIIINM
jgi:hypothetical protein